MRRFALAVAVVAFAGTSVVQAEDKPDPTGTWKWTTMRGDQARESTLKLKLEGDKLTGTMVGRNNQETAIEEASFKDGQVVFSVSRERQGQKITTKYTGKLEGDTLKGKYEFERNGEKTSRDWEAKRSK